MRYCDFYNAELTCNVGEHDTFAVPFVIKHHVPLQTEEYVFTVRRIVQGQHRMGKPPVVGDVVFQQIIKYADLNLIKDSVGDIVGCYFFVVANKQETANIPAGINAYDLAIRDTTAGMELELVAPHKFVVGEVLRYE